MSDHQERNFYHEYDNSGSSANNNNSSFSNQFHNIMDNSNSNRIGNTSNRDDFPLLNYQQVAGSSSEARTGSLKRISEDSSQHQQQRQHQSSTHSSSRSKKSRFDAYDDIAGSRQQGPNLLREGSFQLQHQDNLFQTDLQRAQTVSQHTQNLQQTGFDFMAGVGGQTDNYNLGGPSALGSGSDLQRHLGGEAALQQQLALMRQGYNSASQNLSLFDHQGSGLSMSGSQWNQQLFDATANNNPSGLMQPMQDLQSLQGLSQFQSLNSSGSMATQPLLSSMVDFSSMNMGMTNLLGRQQDQQDNIGGGMTGSGLSSSSMNQGMQHIAGSQFQQNTQGVTMNPLPLQQQSSGSFQMTGTGAGEFDGYLPIDQQMTLTGFVNAPSLPQMAFSSTSSSSDQNMPSLEQLNRMSVAHSVPQTQLSMNSVIELSSGGGGSGRSSTARKTETSSAETFSSQMASQPYMNLNSVRGASRRGNSTERMPPMEKTLTPHYSQRTFVAFSADEDPNWLSSFQCFLRSDILELFRISNEGIKLRNSLKSLSENQVGIRCRFCAHLPHGTRANRASCFPSKIDKIYQSFTMMLREHFPTCTEIPDNVKKTFTELQNMNAQGASNAKGFWEHAAKKKGLFDGNGKDGLKGIHISEDSIADAALIPPFGSGEDFSEPDPPIPLVHIEDKRLVSKFLYLLMEQTYRVHLAPSERKGNRKSLRHGMPGFGCKYCYEMGRMGLCRLFPARRRTIHTKIPDLFDHIKRCPLCPQEVKDTLLFYHTSESGGMIGTSSADDDVASRGREREFFERVWKRLGHIDDGD